MNSAFWYFIQGTAPFIARGEYWFASAGYWAWLNTALCKLIRMYYKKDVEYNPMKHIEKALDKEVISELQPLRNLETVEDLKKKMRLLMDIYNKYAQKISKEQNLSYNKDVGVKVKEYTKQFLS